MISRFYSVAVLLLVACASLQSQPPEQPQPGQTVKTAARSNQRQSSPPIHITVTTPEKGPTERQEESARAHRQDATNDRIAQANDRMAHANDRMAAFTFWLVIVGVLQFAASVFTFGVARQAAKIAKHTAVIALAQKRIGDKQLAQMGAQIEIARINADVAKASVAVSERTMILSHRAVVHIARLKFHEWGATHPEIEITLMNSGTLGAILKSGRIGCVLGAMPNVPEPTSLVSMSLSAIIPPHVTAQPIVLPLLSGDTAVVWDDMTWKDILTGKKRISIYGAIVYETGLLNASGETGFGFEFASGLKQQSDYASRFAPTTAPSYNYTS